MKRAVTNSLVFIAVMVAIIALNLVFYTESPTEEEYEWNGRRSTYSARLYGTRAFYILLRDLGYHVTQFEEPLDQLREHADIKALFIIAPPLPFSVEEFSGLEEWIHAGGHLVIIDRKTDWIIANATIHLSTYPKQWRRPHILQPTPLTAGVKKVQLTEFAQGVKVENAPVTEHIGDQGRQMGDQGGSVLTDFRYGQGRIVLLGEPYIVANNGIGLLDNVVLASNIVRSLPDGVIAFDEYHHGYGLASSAQGGIVGVFLSLYAYFKPTPVIWIVGQLCLIAGAWLYSRGRRFTRPVRLPEEKRRRSLEFVASMANLAQEQGLRSLVLENIHRSLKRRLTPSDGSGILMRAPLSRAGIDQREIHQTLLIGETSANGNTMSDHELIAWVKKVRELEARLGRMK
ncbi:MAG: DUF4350 domain-containing protein [Acidobacteria bacterium]|nr:DUF4350 domain-containing protein [Acidobacteriota bacterium]